jgi:hypothetical protein
MDPKPPIPLLEDDVPGADAFDDAAELQAGEDILQLQ